MQPTLLTARCFYLRCRAWHWRGGGVADGRSRCQGGDRRRAGRARSGNRQDHRWPMAFPLLSLRRCYRFTLVLVDRLDGYAHKIENRDHKQPNYDRLGEQENPTRRPTARTQ
jgi:hypothetical protein